MSQADQSCSFHEAPRRRLEEEIRRQKMEIERQRRQYRVGCAERMRLWIREGHQPHALLKIMEREKREQLASARLNQVGLLTEFLDLGIAEARSEAKLLYSLA